MRYMKAADVLPPDLLAQVQAYIDGEDLYIPRRETSLCGPAGGSLLSGAEEHLEDHRPPEK